MQNTNDESFVINSRLHGVMVDCIGVPGGHNGYSGGFVATPAGIVGIYQQSDLTKFWFVHRGRLYTRSFSGSTSERGTRLLAHRFAREVLHA